MPMTPIAVDKGAIYKKQAADQVAGLKHFEADADKSWTAFKEEQNKQWEAFVKQSETDTQNYYANVHALATAATANGVSADQLKASLFEMGFANAMQGLPSSHIRLAVSGMARQLLAPENKEAIGQMSEQMKHVFDVPTKDEVLADVKSQIEEQAAAAGQQVPKEKMDAIMAKYGPVAEKAVAKRQTQVDSLKQQVAATEEALNAAHVPDEEKEGAYVLVGYQAGAEAHKLQEQQQAAFLEMLQKLQGSGGKK